MEVKYYQKLKCRCKGIEFEEGTCCGSCKGSGITKGADITSTIKPILEGIILSKLSKIILLYGDLHDREERIGFNRGLQKAKRMIEENVINVEE